MFSLVCDLERSAARAPRAGKRLSLLAPWSCSVRSPAACGSNNSRRGSVSSQPRAHRARSSPARQKSTTRPAFACFLLALPLPTQNSTVLSASGQTQFTNIDCNQIKTILQVWGPATRSWSKRWASPRGCGTPCRRRRRSGRARTKHGGTRCCRTIGRRAACRAYLETAPSAWQPRSRRSILRRPQSNKGMT